jgi:uncharacterized iron-regulated membrane protein
MHRLFLVCHRWIALVTSLFIFAIAITGAAVVFEQPVARAGLMHVAVRGTALSLDSLAAIARATAGGAAISVVSLGGATDLPYTFVAGSMREGRPVTLDPYTGEVLPSDTRPHRAQKVMRTLHVWHTRLTGGTVGDVLVTIATFAALVLTLSGLILWWRDKIWRVRHTASWKRINFDLHHVLGLLASVAIVVMTLTGVWMLQEEAITPLVRKLDRNPAATPEAAPHDSLAAVFSIDSLAARARRSIPGAALINIQLQPTGVARAQLKYPEDRTPAGRSFVYLDAYRGNVLSVASTRDAQAGQALINLRRSLHTGDSLGLPTQIIWFLAALVLASQGVTGVIMWWNGRRARQAKRAQSARRSVATAA